nr:hypothetical protein [uncultured Flavobacterium sp.]
MIKTPDIKKILGLTQEEMALVLGINRSQWTMFKAGQRDIPAKAKNILTALLKDSEQKKVSAKEVQQLRKEEQQKAKDKLQREYVKLQVKLQRLEKEIASLENLRKECFGALETASYLENSKEDTHKKIAPIIRSRAIKALKNHSLYKLEHLQLQKENLEMLKLKIGKKMGAAEK